MGREAPVAAGAELGDIKAREDERLHRTPFGSIKALVRVQRIGNMSTGQGRRCVIPRVRRRRPVPGSGAQDGIRGTVAESDPLLEFVIGGTILHRSEGGDESRVFAFQKAGLRRIETQQADISRPATRCAPDRA